MAAGVTQRPAAGRAARLDRDAPWAVLAAITVAAAAIALYHGRGLSFYYDEWAFVLDRAGHSPEVLLRAHHEHPSLFPLLVYKALFELAGLAHYSPYLAVHAVICQLTTLVAYLYARPRLGRWWALLPAVAIALVGSAPDFVLWPFEMTFALSLLGGVGALLCFDRGRDAAGCALLVMGVFSSGVGIAMLAGVVVEIALRPDRRRRWWVAAVPLGLYLLWRLAYPPGIPIDFHNVVYAPRYAEGMYVAGVGALTTLDRLAPPVALVIVAAALVAAARGGAGPARLWALMAMPVTFAALTAVSRYRIVAPEATRYQYPMALLVALVAVELLRGRLPRRIGRSGTLVIAALAGALLVNDAGLLSSGDDGMHDFSRVLRPELGALELVRPQADPAYAPDPGRAPTVTAGPYFAAIDRYGSSPAASLAEIESAAPDARAEADRVMRQATGMAAVPTSAPLRGAPPAGLQLAGVRTRRRPSGCLDATARGPGARASLMLAPGRSVIVEATGDSPVDLGARRFADAAAGAGQAAGRRRVSLTAPAGGGAERPWSVDLASGGRFVLCTPAG